MSSFLSPKRAILIILTLILEIGIVKDAKNRQIKYEPPKNFVRESNIFPSVLPTHYYSKEDKKVSIMIPPEYTVETGAPKTADGKLHPDFITGKKNFNTQFGIKDWRIENYSFTNEKNATKLEIIGNYKSGNGITNIFVEHHYFSKKKQMQSINLIYPQNSDAKMVQAAKLSMDNFNPSFE